MIKSDWISPADLEDCPFTDVLDYSRPGALCKDTKVCPAFRGVDKDGSIMCEWEGI